MKSILINLLVAVFAVGNVYSACDENVTVKKEGDLKDIQGCSKYKGNISFEKAGISDISFPSLEELDGDFEVSDDKSVSSIAFPKLKKAGNIKITKLGGLGKLDLSKLKEAKSVVLEELTPLAQVSFTAGLESIGDISISKNQVVEVKGLKFDKAGSIKISANVVLEKLDFPELKETSGEFRFENINQKAEIKVPKLEKVGGDVFYTNSSVFAAPEIKEVKGFIHIANCNDKTIEFKKLEKVAKGLTLTTNPKLGSASFPVLKSLEEGGLKVYNNPELKSLDISKLDLIAGGFNVTNPSIGNLTLNENIKIDGAVNVFANVSCSDFQKQFEIHANGEFECTNSDGDANKKIEDGDKGEKNKGGNKGKGTSDATQTTLTFIAPLLALFAGFYLL